MAMGKRVWVASGAAALLAASVAFASAFAWHYLHTPMNVPEDGAWLEVARGRPLSAISDHVAARGLTEHAWLLTLYGRVTGDATRVRAGEYRLEAGTTPLALLQKLVAGQVFLHQLTVVEGWRFGEFLAALRNHPAIVAGGASGAEIMVALGMPDVHPEGQFFPDTYYFAKETPEIEVLREAHRALQTRLESAWQNRGDGVQLQTPYEALVLASIIEKETALASERRLISGVFHQRLARGMRLQTDPTVIYGIGDAFDGNLRSRDLAADTPYNTYTRRGLPPTPIALPGGASIEAAVTPEITDALYFVATGRPDGSHYFSATLEEHDRRVLDYLRCATCDR
jgi:UPF0755 protein